MKSQDDSPTALNDDGFLLSRPWTKALSVGFAVLLTTVVGAGMVAGHVVAAVMGPTLKVQAMGGVATAVMGIVYVLWLWYLATSSYRWLRGAHSWIS